MNTQVKMIIITSDEDFIHQLSLNKSTNTRIFDLNNDDDDHHLQQITSMNGDDNNNIINLAFLAQLSELNSASDQVYKQALDTPHHSRARHSRLSKKSNDAVCVICGDRAIGFNYDALSCASCKAFFRRNAAHQYSKRISCLTGHGQCSVAHEIQRKCPRCRLDRCFAMGMRKDFIISDEEKQRRKQRLEENRKLLSERSSTSQLTNLSLSQQPLSNSETLDEIDRLLLDLDKDDGSSEMENLSLGSLSIDDWITIENIRSSFLFSFRDKDSGICSIDESDHVSALVSWSHYANEIALRFIHLFRQINEFENLHQDDRFLLIKFNLISVFPLFRCYVNKSPTTYSLFEVKNDAEKHRRFFTLCGSSRDNTETFLNLILFLVEVTEQDPTVIFLLMVIMIFSQCLSVNEGQPLFQDSLAISRAQNHYTQILWNYLLNRMGETQACKYFLRLLTVIFRIQSVTNKFRDFFRTQFLISNTVDRMGPLMQTVLNIS